MKGSVLVVGGGISGVQAALDLAEMGFYCHLIESSPSIGGHMAMLDKTFPTNDCSACILSPKLVEVARHPYIKLHTMTDLVGVEGDPGAFEARIRVRQRYVDMERCIACGECAKKCPKKVEDPFNLGLNKRKAIFLQYPQAIPLKYCIDESACIYLKKPGRCGFCKEVCPRDAINFEDRPKEFTLECGALVLATGFSPFDPSKMDFLGYGVFKNVVTALEFERILSPSGPTRGHLEVPGLGEPKKIAWLQCVGSRDRHISKNRYCSSVCCMYAIKQAVIAREHAGKDLETTIFFMDQRTFGKGFEEYARGAQESGVNFVHARVHTILKSANGPGLVLRYSTEPGQISEEEYDLVVLSTGLEPSHGTRELVNRLGLDTSPDGFIKAHRDFSARQGIFVLGATTEPKDIPQSVMEASGVASQVGTLLKEAQGKDLPELPKHVTRSVFAEPPRIGVFVCSCGINIGSVVDVDQVARYARTLPGVVYATSNLFTCSQDTISHMTEIIRRENLNRVVVASCSPRTHEPLFQETLEEAGINRYLFEMANIRDQDSWVHQGEPEKATQKAKDLVRMAVEKVRLKRELAQGEVPVEKAGLVVGGGVAGMVAALDLADKGFRVHLVEKKAFLGGHSRKFFRDSQGIPVKGYVESLKERIQNHPSITLHLGEAIEDVTGSVGQFKTRLKGGETISHGIAIVAVGAESYKPRKHRDRMKTPWGREQFLHGINPRVFTLLEFDQMLMDEEKSEDILSTSKEAVFIHCVGSRIEDRPYCSKVCCTHAITQALYLKEKRPDMKIYMLYRDIRTYGRREYLYEQARERGIIFIRYDLEHLPKVLGDEGAITVETTDPILGEKLELRPDLLVLASAVRPRDDIHELAKLFKCAIDQNGFLLEAHMKLRPVDFATEGVFLCGLCHYPKPMEETIAQAKAAAGRAATILSKDHIPQEAVVAEVLAAKCTGCGLCERICPYGAVVVNRESGKAEVNKGLCKGCGACVAGCRSDAITLPNEGNQEIMAAIEGVLFELGA